MVRSDTRAWAAHSFTSSNSGSPSTGGGSPGVARPQAGVLPGPGPVPADAAGAQVPGWAYARGLRAAGGGVAVRPPVAWPGGIAVVRRPGSAGPGAAGSGARGA